MKVYNTDEIRNVCLLGHSGSGKSTFAEALLFRNGKIDRMGKTEDGNLTADYDPEEARRGMSLNASLTPIDTKTLKINLLDCPGSRDFMGEAKAAAHACEGAVVFVDARSGVQVGTEIAMEYVQEYELPAVFFINKLDAENSDFDSAVTQIADTFGKKAVALTMPLGKESDFSGYIDIFRMKAVQYADGKSNVSDIPADLQDQADALREQMVEAAAEGEDALIEKYFEEGELTPEEIDRGLKAAFLAGSFYPVFCGSAVKCIGINSITHFVEAVFPKPTEMPGLKIEGEDKHQKVDPDAPFSAFVFKTVSDDFAGRLTFFKVMTGKLDTSTAVQNVQAEHAEKISHILTVCGKKQIEVDCLNAGDIGVLAKLTSTSTNQTLADPKNSVRYAATNLPQQPSVVAIKAHSAQDEDKIGMALHSLIEQDPTLELIRDPETKQTLLKGMGDQHLDVAVARLKAKSKVEVDLIPAKVRYRETIRKKAEGTYRHKKQSGGRGQFAEVSIRLAPMPDDSEEPYTFKWSVFGGAIPTNFQSAIDKGAQQAMEKGILAGYRVVNVEVDCYDGKHHPVDSSDMAFQIAASQAFRQIAQKADPVILEPISLVTTTVPDSNMGDVMGDVSQRRGRIQGSENVGNKVIVKAMVPEAELMDYAQNLTSMTGGHGIFEREFSHYEAVPSDVQAKIVAEAEKEAEEES